jgi:hypothetical protein
MAQSLLSLLLLFLNQNNTLTDKKIQRVIFTEIDIEKNY